MIPEEVKRAAEDAYRETLTELRLNERGPFKSGSHHKRALYAALEASALHMQLDAVEKVRQELFDVSNDEDWHPMARAAYRDASRAIHVALAHRGQEVAKATPNPYRSQHEAEE